MKQLLALTLLVFGVSASAFAGCRFMDELTGSSMQMGTMLVWSTDYEDNTGRFIVERSENGTHFEQVGIIEAAGNSEDVLEYHFLDLMATPDAPFYRLRVVDLDGSYSHGNVAEIGSMLPNNFMVADMSGGSVSDLYEVTVDALTEGTLDYRLEDWFGIHLLEDRMAVINGLNDLAVDMSIHPEGIYKLHLQMGSEVETLVFKKMLEEVSTQPNVATKNDKTGGNRN